MYYNDENTIAADMEMKYTLHIHTHTTHYLHKNDEHNNMYYNDVITITSYIEMQYTLHKHTTH